MNKEVKFSRFIGITIVIICIWIVVLALMSAMLKNENNDNMIYVDEGSEASLSIPKSNIIANCIDIEKEVAAESKVVDFKVRLPRINIETDVANSINEKIYSIYQKAYEDILKTSNIQKIDIDYTYEYIDNNTIIEITITTKMTANDKTQQIKDIFAYDLSNDKEVVDKE